MTDSFLDLDRKYRIQSRYTAPIVWDRAQGVRAWDLEGKEYLDFESGAVSAGIGHGHPRYVEALRRQMERLIHCGSSFLNVPQVQLGKQLVEVTGSPLRKTFFASTGSEVNEAALRLAKLVTGRFEVVALMGGNHGKTLGAFSLTGFGGAFRQGYGPPAPGVVFFPPPYAYRCPFKGCPPCNLGCLRYGEQVLDRTSSGQPAAVFVEPVLCAMGVVVPPAEYIQGLRRLCDERGALLVMDEAITGLGRTGEWFGYQHHGVVPDVVTLSKSLGGGLPLSGMLVSEAVAAKAEACGYHQASTYTGDPLLAAAGLANIEILESEQLVPNAAKVGAYLKAGLEEIQARSQVVGEVTGRGLMIGVEIVRDRASREQAPDLAWRITERCRARGLILSHRPGQGGLAGNTMRFLPPLILTRQEADAALAIFEQAIDSYEEA